MLDVSARTSRRIIYINSWFSPNVVVTLNTSDLTTPPPKIYFCHMPRFPLTLSDFSTDTGSMQSEYTDEEWDDAEYSCPEGGSLGTTEEGPGRLGERDTIRPSSEDTTSEDERETSGPTGEQSSSEDEGETSGAEDEDTGREEESGSGGASAFTPINPSGAGVPTTCRVTGDVAIPRGR